MLNARELEEYFAELKLPIWASDYVRYARQNSPSREVAGGERSMTSTWVSDKKMPFTQDVESRTHELVYARMRDADPTVDEIWAQPPPIKVIAADKTGRRSGHWYHPDFLTLYRTRCVIDEIKKTEELKKLAAKKPDQWQFFEGRWHYLPAEVTCKDMGLIHETHSPIEPGPSR